MHVSTVFEGSFQMEHPSMMERPRNATYLGCSLDFEKYQELQCGKVFFLVSGQWDRLDITELEWSKMDIGLFVMVICTE